MTDSETQPTEQGATLAHAEMEAAVEAVAETNEQPATVPAEARRRRRPSPPGGRGAHASETQDAAAEEGVEEMDQESRAEARAGSIRVRQGAIGRAEADTVEVSQGAVGMARADHIAVRQAACGLALGGEVRLEQSFGRLVAARETVSLQTSGAWNVLADKVEVHPGSGVVFLVARRVEGDVRPVFDWRGALAFGVAMGLVGGLVRRRRR